MINSCKNKSCNPIREFNYLLSLKTINKSLSKTALTYNLIIIFLLKLTQEINLKKSFTVVSNTTKPEFITYQSSIETNIPGYEENATSEPDII
jgi:hypothetical protein